MKYRHLPDIPADKLPFNSLKELVIYKPPLGVLRTRLIIFSPHTNTIMIGENNQLYTLARDNRSGGVVHTAYSQDPSSYLWSDTLLQGLRKAGYITYAAIQEHKRWLVAYEDRRKHHARLRNAEEALNIFGLKLTVRQQRAINQKAPKP